MRNLNIFTKYYHTNLRNRLAGLQKKYRINEVARQIIQSEIEAACQYWFEQGGGNVDEFEKKYNGK